MNIKLRLLQLIRNIIYVFKLQPVDVKQIDISESKLKGQHHNFV
ncbi:hypothetical protein L917_02740 [Phytophthora nicotianae]|uniref:Uncharacterized protein n=2 Tax=Phytophthora nicotianae TaxID=4792 RepID=V9FUU8_PHYNI|nr:hypothetical protein F443_02968 [Phytophthora nicotianae P1569]ETM00547.1 hypothetical protein L917_02740 [Phytophthora nicotianae]